MRRVAPHEDETVLGIEQVVGVAVVSVQPAAVRVALDLEDVRVAVRIGGFAQGAVKDTAP
jgi:hypothetical protein